MDSDLLRAYRDRWQAVAAIERAEQRETSLEQRWEQLNYLYLLGQVLADSGDGQEMDTVRYREEECVWLRWAQIKGNL